MKNLAFIIAFLVGCQQTYVEDIEPLTPVAFEELKKEAFDLRELAAKVADHEERIASLEKACVDGKPNVQTLEPKKESPQIPKRKQTARQRVKCIVFSTEGCQPCDQLKAEIEKELTGKLGWTAGSEEADIVYRESNAWPSYPVIEFRVDDIPKRRIFGRIPAAEISTELRRLIDNLDREA